MTSEQKSGPTDVGEQNIQECNHHWIIEPAHGSMSRGVCQTCREVRQFRNSVDWEYGNRKPGRPPAS